MLALSVAAALLPTSGCSFLAVKPPPEHPAFLERVDCTTSYSAPTFDTLLGIVQLVVSVSVVGSSPGSERDALARFDTLFAAAQLGTAIWGFRKVSACNDLMRSQALFRPRGPSAMPPLVQPVTPAPAKAAPVAPTPPVPQKIDDE